AITVAGVVVVLPGVEETAGFPRRDEQEPKGRVERRWHPVGPSPLIGTHTRPIFAWDDVREEHGAAVGSNLLRPAGLDEWLPSDQFPGRSVEDIEEAIAVREHHDLPRLAPDRQVGQDGILRRVP